MNKMYFDYLIEQFKQSTGIKNIDINSEKFKREFNDWINNRVKISNNYLELLKCIGINIDKRDTAEVNKGSYDSIIIKNNLTNPTIITPYEDLHLINEKHITSNFIVLGGFPTLIETDDKNNTIIRHINKKTASTYITENPYTLSHIENFDKLHNSGEYNIILGMYGNNFDKDKQIKIKELNEFSSKLNDNYISNYSTIGDTYYYVVASKKNIRKRTKSI